MLEKTRARGTQVSNKRKKVALTRAEKIKTAVKYFSVLLLLYIAGNAQLFGIRPFAAGLYMALIFLGLNSGLTSGLYILAAVAGDFSLPAFLSALTVSVVFLLTRFIEYRTKKKAGAGMLALLALLGQTSSVVIMAVGQENPLQIFLSVFFAVLFMYAGICFFRPVFVQKLKYKLLDYEVICGCVVLIVLSLGLCSLSVFQFPLIGVAALLMICMLGYIHSPIAGLVSGICIGIGCALFDNEGTMLACFALMALFCVIFLKAPRIFSAAAGVLGYIMFVYYFNADYSNSYLWIIALAAGGMLFVLIPKKSMDKARAFFSNSFSRTALRFVVNHNRISLGNSLLQVSDIFHEMSGLMSGLQIELGEKHTAALSSRVYERMCASCANRALCGAAKGVREGIDEIVKLSVKKGRATVVDLPRAMTENCIHVAQMISFASEVASEYNKQMRTIENENTAKKIVAEQLTGISGILKDLGVREAQPLHYDLDREHAIMEELTYRNIICSEALVTGVEYPTAVTLVVLHECVSKPIIEKVLSKIMHLQFHVTAIEDSILSGWSVVHAQAAPRYDVVFGFAACPKNAEETSGDTHSFIKINNNKFMMALCDGMGSGQRARKFSEVTMSLIENFYKAGFEHHIVLESVNKFLSLSGDEIFSAVDVCVADLETGEADLIKIGSPSSYIKGKDTVLKIDGNALPIGVLEEMRPSISTQKLTEGDIIVMTTDGISDSYEGDALADILNNSASKNPQQLCTSIVEKTLQKTGEPKDDMTVAAFRIFPRI